MVDVEALAAGHFQATRIEPELVQDGGVNVRHVVPVLGGMKPNLIRRAMHRPAPDPAPSQPHGEAKDVVVASVAALRPRRPAELRGEHDQRLVEQAASFEIHQERANGLVHGTRQRLVVGLEPGMGIPCTRAAAAVLDLDEAHASLNEPPGRQQLAPQLPAMRRLNPIQRLRLGRLPREIDDVRHRHLHAVGEVIGRQPRGDGGVLGVLDAPQPVQRPGQVQSRAPILGRPRALVSSEVKRMGRVDAQGNGIMGGP